MLGISLRQLDKVRRLNPICWLLYLTFVTRGSVFTLPQNYYEYTHTAESVTVDAVATVKVWFCDGYIMI